MAKRATARKLPETSPEVSVLIPCYDRNRYTCIEVLRDTKHVHHIPLDVSAELSVQKLGISQFDDRFKPIAGYPLDKALAHYRRIAESAGVTAEAQKYLGQIDVKPKHNSIQELQMPTTKKEAVSVKPPTKSKLAAVKTPAKAKGAATKSAPAAKTRTLTAAGRFQELIMEGKLTDDQIFAKVQKEFDLDDSKKGYVKWYRNYLVKQGKNPPEARVK